MVPKVNPADNSAADLFGMVSSRDPNSKVVGDLQRSGINLGHELNHMAL